MVEKKKIGVAMIVVPIALVGAGLLAYTLTKAAPPKLPIIYTCPYCSVTFSTEAELLAHIASAHPGQPPVVQYTCSICGEIFSTKALFLEHMASYQPEHEQLIHTKYEEFLDQLVLEATNGAGGYMSEAWFALPMETKAALQDEADAMARQWWVETFGVEYPIF